MVGVEQNSMADHFRHGCGVGGYNRLPRGHGLEKYDAEAFLYAGQTKGVGSIVLLGEFVNAHVADPGDEAFDAELARQTVQSSALGPVADNSHFQLRNAAAEYSDGSQQYVQAFARVESADR